MNEAAKLPGEIGQGLDRVARAVADAHAAVEHLLARVNPVLDQGEPQALAAPLNKDMPTSSDLGTRLHQVGHEAEILVDRLQAIVGRIAL